MSGVELSACRWCGAAIRWVVTVAGKSMPVDECPTVDGNVVIGRDGRARALKKWAKGQVPEAVPRYMPHFATCRRPAPPRNR